MSDFTKSRFTLSRRALMTGAAATLATPSLLRAQSTDAFPTTVEAIHDQVPVKRNVSSFQQQRWQDHFETLGVGCLLADIESRALHYWGGDGETYILFPSSVPMSEELTRRGYSKNRAQAGKPQLDAHRQYARARSHIAAAHRRGCAQQPAWNPRALSGLARLPCAWHA